MSTFNPLVPTGLVNLDEDYKNLQLNFAQTNTSFGIDHKPLTDSSSNNGYHTVVHLVPFSTTTSNPPNNQPIVSPSTVAGIGELFDAEINDGVNTDEALFFKTGGGRLIQLTRNFVPVSSNNGYTFLPGGLILQWGQINSVNSSFTTLTFSTANIAFPTSCFNIWTQPYGSGTVAGGSATVDIRKSTISNTSFQWAFVTNSSQYTGFFWAAIGN